MKLLIAVIVINLILLASPALSKDYPAGYLGPGNREYLEDKIDGYEVPVEEFLSKQEQQATMIDRKNQILEMVSTSYQANVDSAYGILETGYEQFKNSNELNWTVQKNQMKTELNVSNLSEFKYIKHSDGKIVRFTNGLPTTIENERVVDEFGNISIKNTRNMQYNNKRLLTSYEATLRDELDNLTTIFCYGIKYSPDSVFYGSYDTNAVRNEIEKHIKEIDSAGNVRFTHWEALSYDGHLLRAFHQVIEDSIYGTTSFTRSNITYENNNYQRISSYHEEGVGTNGLEYVLDRTNITYNDKHMVTGYHEEIRTTQIDGQQALTIIDAQFEYLYVPHQFGKDVEPDPDKLLESIITTTAINPDGSERTETTTTTYEYDANQQLIGASGNSVFFGQEVSYYEYTDSVGHILSRDEDEEGNVTYSYIDPDTGETVIVPEGEVTSTLKEGNQYRGTSQIQYEILYGRPMTKQVDSLVFYYGQNISEGELIRIEDSTVSYNNGLVNNLRRVLGSQEHTEVARPLQDPDNIHREIRDITTNYLYDAKGNLVDAEGSGTKTGWEYVNVSGWFVECNKIITIEYTVILGNPLVEKYHEEEVPIED